MNEFKRGYTSMQVSMYVFMSITELCIRECYHAGHAVSRRNCVLMNNTLSHEIIYYPTNKCIA